MPPRRKLWSVDTKTEALGDAAMQRMQPKRTKLHKEVKHGDAEDADAQEEAVKAEAAMIADAKEAAAGPAMHGMHSFSASSSDGIALAVEPPDPNAMSASKERRMRKIAAEKRLRAKGVKLRTENERCSDRYERCQGRKLAEQMGLPATFFGSLLIVTNVSEPGARIALVAGMKKG